MINRIIAPELLELIEQGDAATLLDAVENVHPAEMADSCINVVAHVDRMATKHTQGEPAQPVVSNASVQTKPASVREILGASMRRCAARKVSPRFPQTPPGTPRSTWPSRLGLFVGRERRVIRRSRRSGFLPVRRWPLPTASGRPRRHPLPFA